MPMHRLHTLRGDRVERARLKMAPNEHCFGVQIATKTIAEGVAAAKLAQEAGGWGGVSGATLLSPPTILQFVSTISCDCS